MEICSNDLRPSIVKDSPQSYLSLMKKCWEKDPLKRPSAKQICEILIEWHSDANILLELELNKSELLKDPYPDNVYRSKFINFTSFNQDSEFDLEEWHKI
ncbi:8633_t:CDS:2 [Cetraspora pellucida]|uniref:8633_t:CDS:1 n=1 Tax=Cetraspora pellucida TaxID=1433469 RepID=A0ACA9K4F5_9GLOM|nr:8633_t:CDS:2 [Cetraspora pellucida]